MKPTNKELAWLLAPWVFGQDPEPIPELRRRAEQGNAEAQTLLGLRYANGVGVPQDYIQANKWVNLATSRSTGEVMDNYRLLRDKLAEKMTASQVAKARRLAREWRPKSWEQLKDK